MKASDFYSSHKEIPPQQLKEIQMDILQGIEEFCREESICYSLGCGSLLGAVRHGGYIPWDDDIDIYILRDDYDRLIKTFPSLYKDRYAIFSLERSAKWDRPYAKAYDKNTLLIEEAYSAEEIGVNIDIYPIDDVPDDEEEWKTFDKRRRRWQHYFGLTSVRHGKNILKTVILILIHVTTFFFSRRKIAEHLSKMAKQFNGKGYKRCFENVQGVLQRHPFSKSLFENTIPYKFEDRTFMAFDNADAYLSNAYGNYWQLPPESKRVTHHSYRAYWK